MILGFNAICLSRRKQWFLIDDNFSFGRKDMFVRQNKGLIFSVFETRLLMNW